MMDYFYIALALGATAMCFKGPRWGIAALAFMLPISKRVPNPPIPLLNAQNLLVLVGLAILFVQRKESERGGGVRFMFPLLSFMLLATMAFLNTMFFYAPARYFAMWDPYEIMIIYKSWLTCVLIYAIGCLVVKTREDIAIVFKGLMLGMAFEAGFVCLEVLVSGPARANGHMFEGNNAGTYLAGATAMALATWLVMGWKSREGRFALAATLASAFGLIFTMSRGNWLSGLVAGSALALVKDRRILVLIILAVVFHEVWLPEKAMDRIDSSFTTAENEPWKIRFREGTDEVAAVGGLESRLLGGSGDSGEEEGSQARLDSSSQVRLYVWNAALRMMKDHPLGVGFGVFKFDIGYYSDVIKFKAAHNSYLQIVCELGMPALAIFLILLGCLLWESLRVYLTVDDNLMRAVGLAAFGTGIAMMASAMFYNHFFLIEVNGQQWLLLGLATQVRRVAATARAASPSALPEKTDAVPLYRLVT